VEVLPAPSNVSLYLPSVAQVLEFLAQKLPNIFSYSSLNTMRSAISLISHNKIENHSIIRRFCKGVAIIKSPRPKYDYVWDSAPVIARLALIYPYSVSLKIITRKLVLLFVLGTGHQVQMLCSIKMSQISLKEKLIIRISDHIKTSKPGRCQLFFCFSRFDKHENLCIIRICLTEQYINTTKDLRPSTCDALFISLTKPHRAIT